MLEVKWTYEVVRELSKQFDSRTKFCKAYKSAYDKANEKGWLKDFYWLNDYMKNNPNCNQLKYTYDYCFSVAKKYKYFEDFKTLDLKVYNYARNHKFISDYHWLEHKNTPKNFYNYETVYKIAKTCKTYTELQKKSRRASYIARDNNWLKDYIWFERLKSNKGPKGLRN